MFCRKLVQASLAMYITFFVGGAAYAQSEEASDYQRVKAIIDVLDTIDPEKISEIYSDDSVLIYGNSPAVVGKDSIKKMQIHFFSTINGMKHNIRRVFKLEDALAAEMTVTYARKDGRSITLPVADVMIIKDGKVVSTQIYMDTSPLFAQKE